MYRVIGRFDTNDYEAEFSDKDILNTLLDQISAETFMFGCLEVAEKNNLPSILFIVRDSNDLRINILDAIVIRAVTVETRVVEVLG